MEQKLRCPRCRVELERAGSRVGIIFMCRQCNGRALATAVARQHLNPKMVKQIWKLAISGQSRVGAKCPACSVAMAEVDLPLGYVDQTVALDLCRRCQYLWFDGDELAMIPQQAPKKTTDPRVAEALVKLDAAEGSKLSDYGEETDAVGDWLRALAQ